tara:strand:- start:1475 stop:1666 length:192 start_codon:yes stop_codon:yes gene_type:complete
MGWKRIILDANASVCFFFLPLCVARSLTPWLSDRIDQLVKEEKQTDCISSHLVTAAAYILIVI